LKEHKLNYVDCDMGSELDIQKTVCIHSFLSNQVRYHYCTAGFMEITCVCFTSHYS